MAADGRWGGTRGAAGAGTPSRPREKGAKQKEEQGDERESETARHVSAPASALAGRFRRVGHGRDGVRGPEVRVDTSRERVGDLAAELVRPDPRLLVRIRDEGDFDEDRRSVDADENAA